MTGGFPSVTLEVYRRYQIGVDPSDEKSWSGWALADTKTWSAADIQSAYEEAYLPGGGAGTGSANGVWLDSANENEDPFVFTGLEIYAPNGSAYQYQIKEVKTSAGAYDTWVVNENASGVTVDNADETIKKEGFAPQSRTRPTGCPQKYFLPRKRQKGQRQRFPLRF